MDRKRRFRDDSGESLTDLPEMKRIKEDLLGFLDESDPDPATQGLDSVMKIFEQEISQVSTAPVVVDLTSESGDSQPELGYLLEASDDELGLPPSSSVSDEAKNEETELVRVDSGESIEIGGLWGFEDQIPSYDKFGEFDNGLFEYSNVCFDASEFSDYTWRLGTMPAE